MSKLSVMQIISSAIWGGKEQLVYDLSLGLQAKGHNVTIISRHQHAARYQAIAEAIALPLKNTLDIKSILEIARIIKEKNIDVLQTHTGRDGWLALLASRIAGRGKVFNTRHTVLSVKIDIIHKWLFNSFASTIFVSETVKNEFVKIFQAAPADKIDVVYNGINVNKFLAADGRALHQQIKAENAFIIGYAGRLTEDKGVHYLIEAAVKLKKERLHFKIVIAGTGEEHYVKYLKEFVLNHQLKEYVQFLGFISDIPSFMSAIDAFVLPCTCQEAFGLVLCEAMICEKPVITTYRGTQKEIIDDNVDGFLIPAESSEAIADTLIELIKDPNLGKTVGRHGKQKVLDKFTLPHMIDSTEKCYFSKL